MNGTKIDDDNNNINVDNDSSDEGDGPRDGGKANGIGWDCIVVTYISISRQR